MRMIEQFEERHVCSCPVIVPWHLKLDKTALQMFWTRNENLMIVQISEGLKALYSRQLVAWIGVPSEVSYKVMRQ